MQIRIRAVVGRVDTDDWHAPERLCGVIALELLYDRERMLLALFGQRRSE